MKLPSLKVVIWCWEERQAITAIALCGASTFMLFLPSDCKDNIYICIQIISRIELVLELQILKLQWYFVDILNIWWAENAKASIRQLVVRCFASGSHFLSICRHEVWGNLFPRPFLTKPRITQKRSILVVNVFSNSFLPEEQVMLWERKEQHEKSLCPRQQVACWDADGEMEKIITVHMLLHFNYSLSCKEPGFN